MVSRSQLPVPDEESFHCEKSLLLPCRNPLYCGKTSFCFQYSTPKGVVKRRSRPPSSKCRFIGHGQRRGVSACIPCPVALHEPITAHTGGEAAIKRSPTRHSVVRLGSIRLPPSRKSTELAAPIVLTLSVKDASLAHRPKEAAGMECRGSDQVITGI